MTDLITTGRNASAEERRAHAAAPRRLAAHHGLTELRLRDDGNLTVHGSAPGYRAVVGFAADAASLVGTYVHVITDGAPAARSVATP